MEEPTGIWIYLIARRIVTLAQVPLNTWHPLDQGSMFIWRCVLMVWDSPMALMTTNLVCALAALGWLAWKYKSPTVRVFLGLWILTPYGLIIWWHVRPDGFVLLLNVACFLLLESNPILTAILSGVATWIYPTGFFMFPGLVAMAWLISKDRKVRQFPWIAGLVNGLVILLYPWKEYHLFQARIEHVWPHMYRPILLLHPFNPFRWAYRALILLVQGSPVIVDYRDEMPIFMTCFNAALLILFVLKRKRSKPWLFAAGNAVGYVFLDAILDTCHQGIILFWLFIAILI
jgi:hypothetical protein